MRLLTYDFDPHRIDAERDSAGIVRTYTAYERYANIQNLALHAYGRGPFVRLLLDALPRIPGVYVLTLNSKVVYVGRARDSVQKRWGRPGYSVIDPRNCYRGGQSTNCRINHLIGEALIRGEDLMLWTHVTPTPDAIERELWTALRPPWNVQSL